MVITILITYTGRRFTTATQHTQYYCSSKLRQECKPRTHTTPKPTPKQHRHKSQDKQTDRHSEPPKHTTSNTKRTDTNRKTDRQADAVNHKNHSLKKSDSIPSVEGQKMVLHSEIPC